VKQLGELRNRAGKIPEAEKLSYGWINPRRIAKRTSPAVS
jgi:hypothetical protein